MPNSAAIWTALAKPRITSPTSSSGTSSADSSITEVHEARSAHQEASNIGRACSTLRLEWYTDLTRALALKSSCDSLTIMADSMWNSFDLEARVPEASKAPPRGIGSISLILISLVVMAWYSDSRKDCGRSPESLMPRFMLTNSCCVIFFLICDEWASVLSMIREYASTYAVSALAKTPSFCEQYLSANFSIMRSIFCASPGSQK
mmetsp:Transcript_3881/g.12017  ORF Transcript_3881/g.12017 Transcript_3881/m.12017 type:complete len:205 (-) Transcript_3881:1795-2409(-)